MCRPRARRRAHTALSGHRRRDSRARCPTRQDLRADARVFYWPRSPRKQKKTKKKKDKNPRRRGGSRTLSRTRRRSSSSSARPARSGSAFASVASRRPRARSPPDAGQGGRRPPTDCMTSRARETHEPYGTYVFFRRESLVETKRLRVTLRVLILSASSRRR